MLKNEYNVVLKTGISLNTTLEYMLQNIWNTSTKKRINKKIIKNIITIIRDKKITLITHNDIIKLKNYLLLKNTGQKLINKYLKLLKLSLETLRNKENIFFYKMPLI